MTRRERLRRCYFHEELDRPAVYSRTGFPSDDPSYDRLKSYLAEHSELKRAWPSETLETPPHVEHRTEPVSDDFERVISILHTPAGDLEATSLVSLKGRPGLHETFFIRTREDAAKYLSLPVPEPSGVCTAFSEADREVGERGIVEVALGSNPAGFAAELIGTENFALMSVTDRDVIYALCERRMSILLRRLKYVLERGIGPFFSMLGEEYVVPPIHGPEDFRDFNVRFDKPVIDLIHEAGGRIHIHCHGRIAKVFQSFLDMGVDVLHPFEGPPMGDITPAEAARLARGRMCLEGNIQIDRMYGAPPDEIRRETTALIADCFGEHRGLIVSPTASPYIRGAGEKCFPQYKAMIDTVLEYGA